MVKRSGENGRRNVSVSLTSVKSHTVCSSGLVKWCSHSTLDCFFFLWARIVIFFSEYYFSNHNLERDFFLRRKMDTQGFLPISLIASFHRVQALSTDISLIMEVSSVLLWIPSVLLKCIEQHFLIKTVKTVFSCANTFVSRLWKAAQRWSWWTTGSDVKPTPSAGPFPPPRPWAPLGPTSRSSSTVLSLFPDRRSAPQPLVSPLLTEK